MDEDTNSVDYWTDDDAEEFEEEQDAYDGFAPVIPATPSSESHSSPTIAGAEDSIEAQAHGKEHIVAAETAVAPATGLFVSCPLCLEAPKESSATRCGHVFCTS